MTDTNQRTGVVPYLRPPEGTHPPLLSPEYASTVLRAPKDPPLLLPHTLTEVTGPLLGARRLGELDHDLTRQHSGEPLGERIIVHGRVLEGDGRPVPNTLVEVWQANSAGRYLHEGDQHPAADPERALGALGHGMRPVGPREPDREERADGLRRGELQPGRHQRSSSAGVRSRPVSTMSNSYASAHSGTVSARSKRETIAWRARSSRTAL